MSIPSSILLAAVAFGSLNAQAGLIERGSGMVYDPALDVTWLTTANYAAVDLTSSRISGLMGKIVDGRILGPSDFSAGGSMTWWAATAWVETLVYAGLDDWRLPHAATSCDGTAQAEPFCRTNELLYMFYFHLGGTTGSPRVGDQVVDGVVLEDIPNVIWSDSQTSPASAFAWSFSAGWIPSSGDKANPYWAWAVRDGDIATAHVPEPLTLSLLMLGAGVGVMVRRRTQRDRACRPSSDRSDVY